MNRLLRPGDPDNRRSTLHGLGALLAIWFVVTAVSYVTMGVVLVRSNFIACVWPVYEFLVSVLHCAPTSTIVEVSIATFFGLLSFVFVLGLRFGDARLVALPVGVLFITVFSGLLWGHAFVS